MVPIELETVTLSRKEIMRSRIVGLYRLGGIDVEKVMDHPAFEWFKFAFDQSMAQYD